MDTSKSCFVIREENFPDIVKHCIHQPGGSVRDNKKPNTETLKSFIAYDKIYAIVKFPTTTQVQQKLEEHRQMLGTLHMEKPNVVLVLEVWYDKQGGDKELHYMFGDRPQMLCKRTGQDDTKYSIPSQYRVLQERLEQWCQLTYTARIEKIEVNSMYHHAEVKRKQREQDERNRLVERQKERIRNEKTQKLSLLEQKESVRQHNADTVQKLQAEKLGKERNEWVQTVQQTTKQKKEVESVKQLAIDKKQKQQAKVREEVKQLAHKASQDRQAVEKDRQLKKHNAAIQRKRLSQRLHKEKEKRENERKKQQEKIVAQTVQKMTDSVPDIDVSKLLSRTEIERQHHVRELQEHHRSIGALDYEKERQKREKIVMDDQTQKRFREGMNKVLQVHEKQERAKRTEAFKAKIKQNEQCLLQQKHNEEKHLQKLAAQQKERERLLQQHAWEEQQKRLAQHNVKG